MKSYKTPTPEKVDNAVARLASPQLIRYFFDNLENPLWIRPLADKGFFAKPPEPVKDGGGFKHATWPASGYLARMASLDPQGVLDIILPTKTENARVIGDFVDAALAMPASLAAKLVTKIKDAIEAEVWVVDGEGVAKLITSLGEGNETKAAFSLADAFFHLKKGDVASGIAARVDGHWFQHYLKQVAPVLLKGAPNRTFSWLCSKLFVAMKFQGESHGGQGSVDSSFIWRRAIEDNTVNHGRYEIPDALVLAVRDGAIQLVQSGAATLPDVLSALEGRKWLVCQRIALHVVRVCAEQAPEVARKMIVSREVFDDYKRRHEYFMLLGERFGMLSPSEQDVVLGWIEPGPDMEEYRQVIEANVGHAPTAEQCRCRKMTWQLERLEWIKQHLQGDWKQRYEQMSAEIGPVEHDGFVFHTETHWGTKSPITVQGIAAKSVPEIVRYLQDWRPDPEDFLGASPEGLADSLGEVIRANPGRFAKDAMSFAQLHPTYVRAFIGALEDALKRDVQFDVAPLFNLCSAVLAKPIELPAEQRIKCQLGEADPSWQYSRDAIARLAETACGKKVPFTLRESLWAIIQPVCQDNEESCIVEDGQAKGIWRDFADHAINTPRGRALHAVVKYAIWARNGIVEATAGNDTGFTGLDALPEVKRILEEHLNPNRSRSPAVRAVYGWFFPTLCWLDQVWAGAHVPAIFPLRGEHAELGWAAWTTYLVANGVWDHVFRVLHGCYSLAADELSTVQEASRGRHDAPGRFAEHIIILYGGGVVPLGDASRLVERFFTGAPGQLRAHAIQFVGTSLEGEESVLDDVLERFVSLWEWYRANVVVGPEEQFPEQLGAFGWWFASGRFDDTWTLQQLQAVVEKAPNVEPHDQVMERLATLSQTMPGPCLACADRMVRGDREGWRVYGWQDHLQQILVNAKQSTDVAAKDIADRLIDHLGKRGYMAFRDIAG